MGPYYKSSFYKIHDAHYFRIIYLLDDELFQAAVSRIITISKKKREFNQWKVVFENRANADG